MFRKFYLLYEALCEEIDAWRVAIKRHRELLEATEPPEPPTSAASNGQHAAETRPARARR
jgi:hypothetical protein